MAFPARPCYEAGKPVTTKERSLLEWEVPNSPAGTTTTEFNGTKSIEFKL